MASRNFAWMFKIAYLTEIIHTSFSSISINISHLKDVVKLGQKNIQTFTNNLKMIWNEVLIMIIRPL